MDESMNSSTENDAAEDWTGSPPVESDSETKSLLDVAREVMRGEWGNGQERRIALANAGYDPNAVKAAMVELLNPT